MLDFVQRLRQLDAEVEALRTTLVRLQRDLRRERGETPPDAAGNGVVGPPAVPADPPRSASPRGEDYLRAYT